MSIFHPNLKIPKPSHSSQIDVFKYFSALFYQILIAEIMTEGVIIFTRIKGFIGLKDFIRIRIEKSLNPINP
jgi:hypothetical protein